MKKKISVVISVYNEEAALHEFYRESKAVFEDGAVVNAETLLANGVVKKLFDGVKVLGRGEITKKVTVQAAKISASAKEKIEAAGGKCEVV